MSAAEQTVPRVGHVCGTCYMAISEAAFAVKKDGGGYVYGRSTRFFCSFECASAWRVRRRLRDLDPGVLVEL